MTTWFWIVAVLLGVTATGFVLLPLYLKPLFVKKSRKDNERDLVNVGLYEERLADLNVQLSDGGIAADEFARMLNELQRNLLDDTRDETPYETPHVDQTVSAEAARLPLVFCFIGTAVRHSCLC